MRQCLRLETHVFSALHCLCGSHQLLYLGQDFILRCFWKSTGSHSFLDLQSFCCSQVLQALDLEQNVLQEPFLPFCKHSSLPFFFLANRRELEASISPKISCSVQAAMASDYSSCKATKQIHSKSMKCLQGIQLMSSCGSARQYMCPCTMPACVQRASCTLFKPSWLYCLASGHS